MDDDSDAPSVEWKVEHFLGAIGFGFCTDLTILLLLVHTVYGRKWPPYVAVVPPLIIYTGVAAIMSTAMMSTRCGIWGETDCQAVHIFTWLSSGALFSCGFIRVYRYHKVLVMYNGEMWPVTLQLALLIPVFYSLGPTLALMRPEYSIVAGECVAEWRVPDICQWVASGVLSATALVLSARLRGARVQAPDEFQAAAATSVTLAAAAISLPLVDVLIADPMGDDATATFRRKTALMVVTTLTGLLLAVPPAVPPVLLFFFEGEEFNSSGDYGLREIREQSLKTKDRFMQSQIDRIVDITGIPGTDEGGSRESAFAEFYLDMISRDQLSDYFLRQAATMRILHDYIRDGAPVAVPLSAQCRNSTLRCKASSAFIFGRARAEMLEKMMRHEDQERGQSVRSGRRTESVTSSRTSIDDYISGRQNSRRSSILSATSSRHSSSSRFSLSRARRDCFDSDKSSTTVMTVQPAMPHGPGRRGDNALDEMEERRREEKKEEAVEEMKEGGGREQRSTGSKRKDPGRAHLKPTAATRRRIAGAEGMADSGPRRPPKGSTTTSAVGPATSAAPAAVTASPNAAGGAKFASGSIAKDVAGMNDVRSAFGLQKKKECPDPFADDGEFSYASSARASTFSAPARSIFSDNASRKGGSSRSLVRRRNDDGDSSDDDDDNGSDLREAALAISNPLFGDPSRMAGRQGARRHHNNNNRP